MAEFLIKAKDATHPDPTKNQAGCYKRGDVVAVMPDGHKWGKEERLPKFVVVKVPGLSREVAQKYIESEVDDTNPDDPIVLTRRKFKVLVDNVPLSLRNELKANGEITVTWSQVKGFVQNKLTGVTE